jgi:hypothetical protein
VNNIKRPRFPWQWPFQDIDLLDWGGPSYDWEQERETRSRGSPTEAVVSRRERTPVTSLGTYRGGIRLISIAYKMRNSVAHWHQVHRRSAQGKRGQLLPVGCYRQTEVAFGSLTNSNPSSRLDALHAPLPGLRPCHSKHVTALARTHRDTTKK